ncbi:GT2 family glycosyltransferase [Nonlabens dokdonensis]|jgi:GT2 family glycosyltransferase|uniref:Glycosyl transferase, family 2 n=2 Tax=Nonlabens dokdonensis TaxID=328515 RepID=L7W6X0_NONDD|nr:glycosyltransferase family A protein [Nonlabens dokdonensis]AGC77425.1 glycosyl transferase, family 2 [Nonlabens dokdonensis DSW-6]PZX40951.1 GT2 family glycosyltransferase [Nonlabens dokdonensis]
MINLMHHDGIAVTESYKGLPIIKAIYKCAQEHPDDYLLIYHKDADLHTFKKSLPELNHNAYFFSNYNNISEDLGYVEDSPFLSINKRVIYPTWLKGTTIVCVHAQLVEMTAGTHTSEHNLLYWLNSIGRLSRSLGVLNYQVPSIIQNEHFNDFQLYRFVKQHYKSRWIFILLLCHLWYERRFPFLAFIKSFFYKKYSVNLDIQVLQKLSIEKVVEHNQYDVVIPTMGRSRYLENVLIDLSKQKILPQQVIIVEQNQDTSASSELDFLKTENYPFGIIHHFIHQTGACNARNLAIEKSSASWVLLFDDDVRIDPSFSELIFNFLKRMHVKCLTFSCLQKGEKEKFQTFLQWPAFGSGCSIVHRDVIKKCKFDMALEHGYGEDVDYGMQIRNAGYDVIYAPQIQMLHLKAPIGGFRKPHVFPWQHDAIQPKPSPQIMFHRKKNYTAKQLLGYKLTLFIKFYKDYSIKNPVSYYKYFKKAWSNSIYWSKKLAQDAKS